MFVSISCALSSLFLRVFFVLYVSFNFILDFIILYYYSLESGLFSNERERKVVYSDEGGGREEQGGVEEEKPITRILCEKKKSFFNKRKRFLDLPLQNRL